MTVGCRRAQEVRSIDDIEGLTLRYTALRDTGLDLRLTYYFTANLRAEVPEPRECTEGDLRWFPLTMDALGLEMPPTAGVALQHWLTQGRHHDETLWSIVMATDGAQAVPLASR